MNKYMVLIDDWQMQCCGDPFSVGENISWLVCKWGSDFTMYMDVGQIDYYYENHSADYQKLFKINGNVARIQALYRTLIPDPTDPTGVKKIKAPGKIMPVSNFADGYEEDYQEDTDVQEFDSYLVELVDARVTPAKKSEATYS